MKNFLSGLLVASLMFGSFSSLAFSDSDADGAFGSSGFSDVLRFHPNAQAITALREDGVVIGYPDGNFAPSKEINRAEFLKIAVEVGGVEKGGENCYSDVRDQWFAEYVCGATEAGLVEGYADGTFKPGNTINFAEASKIIVKALNVEEGDEGSVWYEKYVRGLEGNSAIPVNVSSFGQKLTRSDMAEIVWRLDRGVTYRVSNDFAGIANGVAKVEVGGPLQSFDSCSELAQYYEDVSYVGHPGMDLGGGADVPTANMNEREDALVSQDDSSEPDYSETNVQVKGVDEADIVKTDGKYIYYLKGDMVKVVEAYPAGNMVELDAISFGDGDFYGSDMYVDGNKLVVLGSSWGNLVRPMDLPEISRMIMPYPGYGESVSRILVFDISDKKNVSLWREVAVEGSYNESRKVGDNIYFVATKWFSSKVNPSDEKTLVPYLFDSSDVEVKPVSTCGDIMYVPGIIDVDRYLMVGGFSLSDVDSPVDVETVLGNGGNVYASKDSLYVAGLKYNQFYDYGEGYDEETVIHKFGLNGGDIEYKGVGSVPGLILNQFSMDESNGYFRIATTTGNFWNSANLPKNNVYVLDNEMKVVGKLEGIAPDESIYSVRFMGDVAYMVTFKNVDPFFVIDLSNPRSPKVLGELKLPGYSDYLHPYKDGYVIGFGKDAVDPTAYDEWMWGDNFAWYQGMKVAMFDVTDLRNPKLLHSMVIGDRGTESELLWNHKALLFDENKGLMAFPLSIATIPENIKNDSQTPVDAYGKTSFVGAHVYDVSVENGFRLRGALTHLPEGFFEGEGNYYDQWKSGIDRILYIGDYLYTISMDVIQANRLSDMSFVKRLELR